MPITSHVKGYPFEIEVNINNKVGAILCDQVRSLDWKARKAAKILELDTRLVEEAISKLTLLLAD